MGCNDFLSQFKTNWPVGPAGLSARSEVFGWIRLAHTVVPIGNCGLFCSIARLLVQFNYSSISKKDHQV
jgi:hypothetical protein